MLDFLGPGEVRDMNEPIHTFFQLHEDTEVREVANSSGMLGVDGYFLTISAMDPG
jgi:hypothetical protein